MGERRKIEIEVPEWAIPLLQSCRYKGVRGGRGGGKSWWMANELVARHVADPNLRSLCLREVQSTLDSSSKPLIEDRIRNLGVADLFDIQRNRIYRRGGRGHIAFKGLQDFNSDSVKSFHGYGIAWCEEAQALSWQSIGHLRPTIRISGGELWFTWNPENERDAVEQLFARGDEDQILVTCNLDDNPWASEELRNERASDLEHLTPEEYAWIWEGAYRVAGKDKILAHKVAIAEFEPTQFWDGPYSGADWGFAANPTVCGKVWIWDGAIYIEYAAHDYQLELNDIGRAWRRAIPGVETLVVRADPSAPETIAHVRKQSQGIPRITAAPGWAGSVNDGIRFLLSFSKIIVHPRCPDAIAAELRQYSYRTNRAGDALPEPAKVDDHTPDMLRYALAPLIKKGSTKSEQLNRRAIASGQLSLWGNR